MGFDTNLNPSKQMWDYMRGDITPLQVVCAIADKLAGFHISYSNNELLKDLSLLSKSGKPNKRARELMAWHIHNLYFKSLPNDLEIVEPR